MKLLQTFNSYDKFKIKIKNVIPILYNIAVDEQSKSLQWSHSQEDL